MKKFLLLFVGVLIAQLAAAQKTFYDFKYVKVGVVTLASSQSYFSNGNFRLLKPIDSTQEIYSDDMGRRVLDQLFAYDGRRLHTDVIYREALNNVEQEEAEIAHADASAEDRDVLKRDITKQLLKCNYIVVENGYKGHFEVYHVEIDDDIINQVYANWNNPKGYEQIHVPVKQVASGKVGNPRKKYPNYSYQLRKTIAKKVPDFAERAIVTQRFPFTAESQSITVLRRADRMKVYTTKEDKDGTLRSAKVATVRATRVKSLANFRLLTIAGKMAHEGDIVVPKDRQRFSMSVMFTGSMGDDNRIGARWTGEHLLNISSRGVSPYLLYSAEYQTFGKEEKKFMPMFRPDNSTVSTHQVGGQVGFGLGYHLLGRLEIVPYVSGGVDWIFYATKHMFDINIDYDSDGNVTDASYKGSLWKWDQSEDRWRKVTGGGLYLTGRAGVKVNLNIWYPLQLTVGADYNHSLALGDNAKFAFDHHKLNRINLLAGLRFSF